jgi:excisionase family DNA binding protein
MQTTLLTTAQAAARLGVSVPTLNRWVRHGRIKPAIEGPGLRGARFFDPSDIDALAADESAA